MTHVFVRFGQTLALLIALIFLTGKPAQANPPASYGGGYHNGITYIPAYYAGYFGGGYGNYPYSTWYGSYPFYYAGYGYVPYSTYGLGYPINGYYVLGYSPYPGTVTSSSSTAPARTSFYQDSNSPVTPAFYSEVGSRADSTGSDMRAHIRVTVPDPLADVVVEGMKMSTTGLVREFRSPALADGNYTYEIRATWMENGQMRTKTEKVRVTPGSWSVVNFPSSTIVN